MGKVTVNQIRQRIEEIERKRQHYEWKSEQPGRLARHEVWRHDYLARPYLIGAPNDQLLDAVRDDETSRTFFIPTYKERLAGKTHIHFQGNWMEFGDDDIVLPLVFDDYYLFSLCDQIHYRMPTDFDADAAIIIREPMRFKQRLISAFLARFPDWVPMEGPVTYYDPYRDLAKLRCRSARTVIH